MNILCYNNIQYASTKFDWPQTGTKMNQIWMLNCQRSFQECKDLSLFEKQNQAKINNKKKQSKELVCGFFSLILKYYRFEWCGYARDNLFMCKTMD